LGEIYEMQIVKISQAVIVLTSAHVIWGERVEEYYYCKLQLSLDFVRIPLHL
jgi:hypothetical protein